MFNPADWVEAHPAMTTLVIVPILTAIYDAVRAPRTPEQWAAMNPIEKTIMKVVRLSPLGWSPTEQLEALKQLRSGGYTTKQFVTAKLNDYAQAKANLDGVGVQVATVNPYAIPDASPTPTPTTVKSFRPAPPDAPTTPELK